MNAALPNVPPPVGIVRVAPAAGHVNVPTPPLFVNAVVRVALVTVAAFPPIERLATGVVEATTNGAVPVARVEVSCPDIPTVVIPERAPAVETSNPEELIEKVSSFALPIVIVFAFTFVPILIAPVVPESILTAPVVPEFNDSADAVPDAIVNAPLSAILFVVNV